MKGIRVVEGASAVSMTRPDNADGLVRPATLHVAKTTDEVVPRVALLTPYDGGNLGDSAIQDAMIENIRRSLPGVRLTGISLSCEEFLKRHGVEGFPLCETDRPFYRMVRGRSDQPPTERQTFLESLTQKTRNSRAVRGVAKRVPVLGAGLKRIQICKQELRHWIAAYRFLRTQDMLIVSGGGQLDEEWGGPWGHPFALFKWAILARIARVPYAFASVGACTVRSTTSRFFLSVALGLARYRSFRDRNSRDIAASLLKRASEDPIVPDLAFGISVPEPQESTPIRSLAADRMVIAISPIAFAKPYNWPRADANQYHRYLKQLTHVVSILLKRGCFLVLLTSSRGDDESVIPDILDGLEDDAKARIEQQVYVPQFTTWKAFANIMREVDLLIASRLHSTILGFVTHRPTIAISFEPKVDWVMNDLGQTEFLLPIRDFVAEDVVQAVDRMQHHKAEVIEKLSAYQGRVTSALTSQYESLANLAMESHRAR